jgi:hypothetical protein
MLCEPPETEASAARTKSTATASANSDSTKLLAEDQGSILHNSVSAQIISDKFLTSNCGHISTQITDTFV